MKNCIFAVFLVSLSCSTNSSTPSLYLGVSGDYLGQFPPEGIPQIFAAGIISKGSNERDITFSPDGNEIYFSIWSNSFGVILYTKQIDGRWQNPQIASFSGNYSDLEPFISSDGEKLFFVSNRPVKNTGNTKDYDIWMVEKKNSVWSDPLNLGSPVNTAGNEFYPTVSKDGTLYLTASYENSIGGEDIFLSEYKNGKYQNPINLGNKINTKGGEFNALISPEENFLIFSSFGRKDGLGGGDLYISYKTDTGKWTEAKNLGEQINSTALDYCPALSPDQEYFFFTSRRNRFHMPKNNFKNYAELYNYLENAGNGLDDIYWVQSRDIIEK